MIAQDLIKHIHEAYTRCHSYSDTTDCELLIALPGLTNIKDLHVKKGTLKHEYKRDKMFDMRWEWQQPDELSAGELDYQPNSFTADLSEAYAESAEYDITQVQALKANLLHGILSMETEDDIFLIKRLIFFGEARFWLEDFIFDWSMGEDKMGDREFWHLKRVDKGHDDPFVEMWVDKKNYTLARYHSDATAAFKKYAASQGTDREELAEALFGDEIKPAPVIQRFQFRDVKLTQAQIQL